ncbi:hypothetical protein ACHAXM_011433 [Skeletonema potamos]|jgi:hypothetical protein
MIFLGTSKVMYEGGIEEKRVVYREVLSNDELREENAGAAVGEAQIDNTDETSNGQNSVMLDIFDSTNATGKSSDKDGSYDGEEGEVMEEPSAAKQHFVPYSINCNGTNAARGDINGSIAVTDSFESNDTITSAYDSLSQKKPKYPSEFEGISSQKAHALHLNVLKIEIVVPLWLRTDCQSQSDIFFHLA